MVNQLQREWLKAQRNIQPASSNSNICLIVALISLVFVLHIELIIAKKNALKIINKVPFCLFDIYTPSFFLLRASFGTIGILANFYAVDYLLLADASILQKMNPFFVIIFFLLIILFFIKIKRIVFDENMI